MDQILHDLLGLLLASIPTVVIFVLLHFYLKAVFFKPIEATLAARKAGTKGAREAARQALDNAERKAAEYETAIRSALTEIYKGQDALRASLVERQAAALAKAKAEASGVAATAKAELRREADAARNTLASTADSIAESIAQAILRGSRN